MFKGHYATNRPSKVNRLFIERKSNFQCESKSIRADSAHSGAKSLESYKPEPSIIDGGWLLSAIFIDSNSMSKYPSFLIKYPASTVREVSQ